MEQRVQTRFVTMRKELDDELDITKRPAIFKRWIVNQVCDPSWGTLTLEFKLYAVRRPEVRERLQNLLEAMFEDAAKDFVGTLFGKKLLKAARSGVERRLAILGGALSGVVLESHFRSAILPANHLKALTEELFDAMIHI